LLFPQ